MHEETKFQTSYSKMGRYAYIARCEKQVTSSCIIVHLDINNEIEQEDKTEQACSLVQ